MEDDKIAGQKKSEESGNPPESPSTTGQAGRAIAPVKREREDLEERFTIILAAKSAPFRPRRRKRVKPRRKRGRL
jgi:hypothetical protein